MLMGLEWNTNPGLWDINGGYDVCVYVYIYIAPNNYLERWF